MTPLITYLPFSKELKSINADVLSAIRLSVQEDIEHFLNRLVVYVNIYHRLTNFIDGTMIKGQISDAYDMFVLNEGTYRCIIHTVDGDDGCYVVDLPSEIMDRFVLNPSLIIVDRFVLNPSLIVVGWIATYRDMVAEIDSDFSVGRNGISDSLYQRGFIDFIVDYST